MIESKEQICAKIPYHNDKCGKELRKVEIEAKFLVKKVYEIVVHCHSYNPNRDKFQVLGSYFAMTLKCKYAVEKIIGAHRNHESTAIGEILIKPSSFLQQIGDTKIYRGA